MTEKQLAGGEPGQRAAVGDRALWDSGLGIGHLGPEPLIPGPESISMSAGGGERAADHQFIDENQTGRPHPKRC